MQKNQLIIFSKVSIAGKVKTRLAEQLGATKAKEIHDQLYKNTISVVKKANIGFQVYLNKDPGELPYYDYKIQSGGNLGDKMRHALKTELLKSEKACIIGSDILNLTAKDINLAFEKLTDNDVVLGPALDGGYYLIGMKRVYEDLFSGVSWGSSSVLKDTIKRCEKQGLSFFLLPQHNDVDRPEDVPFEWL